MSSLGKGTKIHKKLTQTSGISSAQRMLGNGPLQAYNCTPQQQHESMQTGSNISNIYSLANKQQQQRLERLQLIQKSKFESAKNSQQNQGHILRQQHEQALLAKSQRDQAFSQSAKPPLVNGEAERTNEMILRSNSRRITAATTGTVQMSQEVDFNNRDSRESLV